MDGHNCNHCCHHSIFTQMKISHYNRQQREIQRELLRLEIPSSSSQSHQHRHSFDSRTTPFPYANANAQHRHSFDSRPLPPHPSSTGQTNVDKSLPPPAYESIFGEEDGVADKPLPPLPPVTGGEARTQRRVHFKGENMGNKPLPAPPGREEGDGSRNETESRSNDEDAWWKEMK